MPLLLCRRCCRTYWICYCRVTPYSSFAFGMSACNLKSDDGVALRRRKVFLAAVLHNLCVKKKKKKGADECGGRSRQQCLTSCPWQSEMLCSTPKPSEKYHTLAFLSCLRSYRSIKPCLLALSEAKRICFRMWPGSLKKKKKKEKGTVKSSSHMKGVQHIHAKQTQQEWVRLEQAGCDRQVSRLTLVFEFFQQLLVLCVCH